MVRVRVRIRVGVTVRVRFTVLPPLSGRGYGPQETILTMMSRYT